MEVIRVILAFLAVYRMSHLFPLDDGPFFAFKRLRLWADTKAKSEQDSGKELGFWANISEGLNCPYCIGLYASFLCAMLVVLPSPIGDFVLLIFALAGAQSALQRWTE